MPARTVEVHAGWAVKADQPGMDGDVGILSLGAWLVFWSPEIDRVLRDKRPVAFENDRFELPVLQAAFAVALSIAIFAS